MRRNGSKNIFQQFRCACVIRTVLLITNTSERPDTTRGKKMAKSTLTENEKTVMITIFAGLLIVAGWTGYASILGFTGFICPDDYGFRFSRWHVGAHDSYDGRLGKSSSASPNCLSSNPPPNNEAEGYFF
jgi:hypothetical protein